MKTEKNLKAKNNPQLWIFLFANILLLGGVIFPEYFRQVINDFDIILIFKILGVSVAPLIFFLLNGLISSHQKAILVFWRFKYPLPGSKAFTELIKLDHRIDRDKLKEKYRRIPKSPQKQNELWYKIYQKNSSNLIVQTSHGAFLLARDLASLSVIFMICLGLLGFLLGSWPNNMYYFFLLILQYSIVRIGARNRGRRFVSNVLAVESSS